MIGIRAVKLSELDSAGPLNGDEHIIVGRGDVLYKTLMSSLTTDLSWVVDELNKKADTAAMNLRLAEKVDIVDFDNSVTVLNARIDSKIDTDAAILLLNEKANTLHSHAISDVTSLTFLLDNKVDLATYTSAMALKSPIGHTHIIPDVLGLEEALAGKASELPVGDGVLKVVTGVGALIADPGTDYVSPSARTDFTAIQKPSVSDLVTPVNNSLTWDLSTHQILRILVTTDITSFVIQGVAIENANVNYQLVVHNAGGVIEFPLSVIWPNSISLPNSGTAGSIEVYTFIVESVDSITYSLYNIGKSQ